MNLETRKINFIQNFLKLESEKTISHLEQLLQKETQDECELKPMTTSAFQKRIKQSTDDATNEKLTENGKLISEVEKWI